MYKSIYSGPPYGLYEEKTFYRFMSKIDKVEIVRTMKDHTNTFQIWHFCNEGITLEYILSNIGKVFLRAIGQAEKIKHVEEIIVKEASKYDKGYN